MKLLLRLMNLMGSSGNEELVRDFISKEIKNHVNEIKIDKLGNLIAIKKGKTPRVMLAAHMDEVGLMVKKIENNGNIKCAEIGGIRTKSLINQKVHIQTSKKPINGIIKKTGKKSKKLNINNLIIKTNLSKKELLKKGVAVGNYISFEPNSKIYKNLIKGKALDDRIGCYVLIELIKKLKKVKNEINFVFTVQEEMGLYGARTSAFEVEPDWAIAIDVTDALDIKRSKKCIGDGPVITIKDSDFIGNKCINNWLKNIAEKKKIPLQYNVSDSGTTDATNISLSRGGVPSTVVGVAIKNIHTMNGVASINDIDNTIKLLLELMKNPPKVCLV